MLASSSLPNISASAAMSAPSAAGLLPWAWAVELLSDYSSAAVPLPLLFEWFKKIPDNSGVESFHNARERFALRCLHDALDSGFHGGADASREPRVLFDSNSSAQDALRKLARIKSEGKSTRAWKKDLEKFIQQKRANLPTPFLRQTTRIAHLISAHLQSSENKCNNVENEGACSSHRNGMSEKAVYKDEIINTSSHAPENMNGNMASGKDVQCYGSKFVSEINNGNLDACTLEETSVARPPDIGRVLPSWAQENDQIGKTCQISEHENDIGDKEIVSGSSSRNNDGAVDFKSSAAKEGVSERLSTSKNMASGEDAQCKGNESGKETNQISINTSAMEGTSVKQPSGTADVLPSSSDRDDNIGDTGQNPEVENDMGQKEILSQATRGKNDEVGDFKSNAAQEVIVKKLKFLLDSQEKQISSSHTTEYSLCIKCAVGGELLTCCNNGCSIGVHADCIGYLKDLDDSGKFYCSFCSYSRAHTAYVKAKKKASIAKKELSTFLNGVLVKEGNFKDVLVDLIKSTLLESNNHVKETKVDQCCRVATSEQLSKQLGGSLDCHKRTEVVRASNAETVALAPINVGKHNVQVNDAGGTGEMNDDNQHKASAEVVMPLDGEVVVSSPFINRAERLDADDKDFNTTDLQSGKDAELITNDIMDDDVDINLVTTGHPQKRKNYDIQPSVHGKRAKVVIQKEGLNRRSPRNLKPTKSYANPSIHVGRRVQLRWTVEEEEALKDLVAKYHSNNGGGIIPWTEILEQGNGVFQRTRKPMDLKDKWKNILKLQDREDTVSGKAT